MVLDVISHGFILAAELTIIGVPVLLYMSGETDPDAGSIKEVLEALGGHFDKGLEQSHRQKHRAAWDHAVKQVLYDTGSGEYKWDRIVKGDGDNSALKIRENLRKEMIGYHIENHIGDDYHAKGLLDSLDLSDVKQRETAAKLLEAAIGYNDQIAEQILQASGDDAEVAFGQQAVPAFLRQYRQANLSDQVRNLSSDGRDKLVDYLGLDVKGPVSAQDAEAVLRDYFEAGGNITDTTARRTFGDRLLGEKKAKRYAGVVPESHYKG